MKTVLLPVNKIKPYDRIPHKNKGAVDSVDASLAEFKWW